MNSEQKLRIAELRKSGYGCKEISEQLQISINTIKSYCKRHNIQRQNEIIGDDVRFCLQCGKTIPQVQHRKVKKFCSDKCRMVWWRNHSSLLHTHSKKMLKCPVCNKAFSAYSSTHQKYCSRLCYYKSKET